MHGTSLMENCGDELSAASCRLTLSDLNEAWGDAMVTLEERERKLKEGLALAEEYQVCTCGGLLVLCICVWYTIQQTCQLFIYSEHVTTAHQD